MMNMHISVVGALAGLGCGIALVVFEYLMLNRLAERRALQKGKKIELDPTEKKQLAGTFRFALFLPIAFAIGAWLIWG